MNALLILTVMALSGDPDGTWPAFLGTGATRIDYQTLPVKWSPTENLAWSRSLTGYGQSSPVIWDGRVYVTTVTGSMKETLHLACLRLSDGMPLWERSLPSSFPQENSVYISRAAPTPVVDERGVYAYFESGDVFAFSHAGEQLWTRSLTTDYGKPRNEFGLSASPVQTADRILILVDDPGPSYIVSLAKTTGEVLWKTDRSSRKSWVSPALVPFGESVQLVVSSAGSVDGYDPQTGRRLWQYGDVGGNTGTTPIAAGNGLFLVSATAGRDGTDADAARKSNGLMAVEREGDDWRARFVWTNPAPTPSWGSPMINEGRAYWVNRAGAVYCLNAATGEVEYIERLKQGCWATPIAVGAHVYVFGKDGLTTVLGSGAEFQILAENQLWPPDQPPPNHVVTPANETEERRRSAGMFSKPTVYAAAMVNGSIILRTGSQLFCVRALNNGS